MELLTFQDRPLWLSVAVFAVSAAVVWWAGSRLAHCANRVAEATGIGRAAVGLVLLGAITSLPEIATSLTAAFAGAAELAVNNLVGGVAFQLVILAGVDVAAGRRALTSTLPRADLLAQAAMGIVMLAIVAGAVTAGEAGMWGFGLGSTLLVVTYGVAVAVSRSMDRHMGWRPVREHEHLGEETDDEKAARDPAAARRLIAPIAGLALVILVMGLLLTRSGEAIAEQTGLGAGFFGAVFLAGATSLPELSSAIAAMRINRPQLAIGDVLGGNLFNLSLIFLVDGAYRGDPVLGAVGTFPVLAAAIGILLNAVLIVGIVERRDRTVLRMGYDSAAMLVLYALGLALMFQVRPGVAG